MLTPVSSTLPVSSTMIGQPTALRGHGSEARGATSHVPADQQVVVAPTPHHASTIGLDAGTILSNVNAEAATAGRRTVLQMLALAVAAQINITRRNDETMEAFFLRIAAALDTMGPEERAATEARTGLKLLRISLPELSAALKQPDSALAARLSAIAEAPLATPQKTAAQSATTSYLQEEPGAARAAETQAMVNQAKGNTSSSALFSSATHILGRDTQAADAKGLQGQLKNLFEPGAADTREEIAARVEEPTVLILGSADDFVNEIAEPSIQPEAEQQPEAMQSSSEPAQSGVSQRSQPVAADIDISQNTSMTTDPEQAEAEFADSLPAQPQQNEGEQFASAADVKAEAETPTTAGTTTASLNKADPKAPEQQMLPRVSMLLSVQNTRVTPEMHVRLIAQELAQANVISTGDEPHPEDKGGRQVQTLLALKGIAEVTTAAAKAAEMPAGNPLRTTQSQLREPLANDASAAGADLAADGDTDFRNPLPNRDVTAAHAQGRQAPLTMTDMQEAEAATRAKTSGEPQSAARSTDPEVLAQAKPTANTFNPVPYAYATLQLAKDEFKADAPDDQRGRDDEDDSQGQEPEDEDARRERLARKATDDLLRPEAEAEPALNITRDSSQSDRAYALYQRMGGF